MYLINMPLILRNVIIAILGILGFLCSAYTNPWAGSIFIIGACIFAWKKSQRIGPDPTTFKDISWEVVEENKVNIAKEGIKKLNSLPKGKVSNLWLIPVLVIGLCLFVFICEKGAMALTLYAVVLFYSLMCSGGNDIFVPNRLENSIKQQENIRVKDPWYIERSMEICKSANIPLNMKTTLKKKDFEHDFLGVQVQTNVNKGPKGDCLYSYCVILAKPEFDLIGKYKPIKINGVVIENATEKNGDVSVLVVRKDGYETNVNELQSLIDLSIKIIDNL